MFWGGGPREDLMEGGEKKKVNKKEMKKGAQSLNEIKRNRKRIPTTIIKKNKHPDNKTIKEKKRKKKKRKEKKRKEKKRKEKKRKEKKRKENKIK